MMICLRINLGRKKKTWDPSDINNIGKAFWHKLICDDRYKVFCITLWNVWDAEKVFLKAARKFYSFLFEGKWIVKLKPHERNEMKIFFGEIFLIILSNVSFCFRQKKVKEKEKILLCNEMRRRQSETSNKLHNICYFSVM